MPKNRQKKIYCPNCYLNFEDFDNVNYCPQCGQENHETRLSFSILFQDYWRELIVFDNTFFRSVYTLFLFPGKLTTAYKLGQRVRYTKPLKLMLILSGFFFFVLSVKKDAAQNFIPKITISDDDVVFSTDKDKLKQDSETAVETTACESEKGEMSKLKEVAQNLNLSEEQVLDSLQIEGKYNRHFLKQLLKASRSEGEDFKRFFIGRLSLMILLLTPIFALVYRLVYFKQSEKFYYIDHLAFCLHSTAYLYLIGGLCLVFNLPIYFAGFFLFIHSHLAQKNFYQESKLATSIKSLLIGIGQSIVFILFLMLTLIVSFWFF